MRAPAFWWQTPPAPAAQLLRPFGALWGAVAKSRMDRAGARAPVPVVCIGNPIAGGAGKTPAAIEIVRLLRLAGRNPVFLTRGYGGSQQGPVAVDAAHHTSTDVGDEPLLLVRTAPCVVAHDRVAGAALAARLGDVIVMDDGFQNPSLVKDLALLVVDAAAGVGNGLCIPAGPLRAPLEAQLARAHAIVLVGEGRAGEQLAARAGIPVFRARLVAEAEASSSLRGRRVLAFAGIGRPQKFAASLEEIGAKVVRLAEFPDHHAFTAKEAGALIEEARRENLTLVTTEKDHVRLRRPGLQELAHAAQVLPVRLAFDDPRALKARLLELG